MIEHKPAKARVNAKGEACGALRQKKGTSGKPVAAKNARLDGPATQVNYPGQSNEDKPNGDGRRRTDGRGGKGGKGGKG